MRKMVMFFCALVIITIIGALIYVANSKSSYIGYVYQVDYERNQTIIIGESPIQHIEVLIKKNTTKLDIGTRVRVHLRDDGVNDSYPTTANVWLSKAKQTTEQKQAIQLLYEHFHGQYEINFYPIINKMQFKDGIWKFTVFERNVPGNDQIKYYEISGGTISETTEEKLETFINVPTSEGTPISSPTQGELYLAEAKALAENIATALQHGDVKQLAILLGDQNIGEQFVPAVYQAFQQNFDLDSITFSYDPNGNASSPTDYQYEFAISANGIDDLPENTKRMIIQYSENGDIRINHPYIYYFPYAEDMVMKYIQLIKDNNAEELALFLNPDDIVVPLSVAQQAIDAYKEQFQNTKMNIAYDHHFTFTIYNSIGEEHALDIIYGDGLMGISDTYIPSFN